MIEFKQYVAKDYTYLLGLEGFSEKLLNTHFALYQGYVTNVNKISGIIDELLKSEKGSTPEFAELKRRFGWEYNGMKLHEMYFENLSKEHQTLSKESDLYKQLVEDFGSIENWLKDFKATSTMRGIGWTVLYFDTQDKRLFNVWVNEHDGGHLTGMKPILVLDVFEHAFFTDYGSKRVDYIEVYFKSINWKTVESRI